MSKWHIKFRIFLWIILAGVAGWLLYMGVVPSGKISYVNDFNKSNYFIKKLSPEERVRPVKDNSQVVIGNPVYFNLHTPRRFNKARLTLKFKNLRELPLIEAGVLVDKTVWRYDLKPIENNLINKLSLVWDVKRENSVILLQRDISASSAQVKKYESIQDFLKNLPDNNEIAIYNYNLDIDYVLEDYEATEQPMELSSGYPELSSAVNYPLRGAYQFYTYIKDEELDFTFNFKDLNKNKDSDEINIHVYYNDQLINRLTLKDDGNINDDGKTTRIDEQKLKLANLPEGAYKIEIKANDDIVTKSIKTRQQKISFLNKLWIHDEGNENISLFTDSKNINAQTISPGSLQKIKINENELAIDKTYKQFSIKAASSTNEIILEKDGIILSGNGVFSFCEECLINPKIKKVDENLDINNDGINYVLADYAVALEEGGWKVAKAEFDLTGAYREDGKYSFLISIPGLKSDDEINDRIEIEEIKIELEGTTLLEKIKKIIK